ncbi:MAG: zinc ribbon domain-containing protein [Clostridia bacterium]|nr:zinc ribbon domain-containing protein [Clostridia bacterium]
MAFCTNCGAPLEPGAAFCTSCGAKVEPLPDAENKSWISAEEKAEEERAAAAAAPASGAQRDTEGREDRDPQATQEIPPMGTRPENIGTAAGMAGAAGAGDGYSADYNGPSDAENGTFGYEENPPEEGGDPNKKTNSILIGILIGLLVVGVAVGGFFLYRHFQNNDTDKADTSSSVGEHEKRKWQGSSSGDLIEAEPESIDPKISEDKNASVQNGQIRQNGSTSNFTGLKTIGGITYYVVNGQIQSRFNGTYYDKKSGKTYLISNGQVLYNLSGVQVHSRGGTYMVEKGVLKNAPKPTPAPTTAATTSPIENYTAPGTDNFDTDEDGNYIDNDGTIIEPSENDVDPEEVQGAEEPGEMDEEDLADLADVIDADKKFISPERADEVDYSNTDKVNIHVDYAYVDENGDLVVGYSLYNSMDKKTTMKITDFVLTNNEVPVGEVSLDESVTIDSHETLYYTLTMKAGEGYDTDIDWNNANLEAEISN